MDEEQKSFKKRVDLSTVSANRDLVPYYFVPPVERDEFFAEPILLEDPL
jgi:hypothetical protein